MTAEPRKVHVQGQRLKKLATSFLSHHPLHRPATKAPSKPATSDQLKIVCISDTHNNTPVLPPGDILIHAGDLTDKGSFVEVQAQLNWLSSQPHKHKIVIAGNHDVLLDETFLDKFPWRRYGQTQTAADLDWGSVTYLEDSTTTLTFGPEDDAPDSETRRVKVSGSPWTPQYGNSAFQYPRDEDIWHERIPPDVDILVTHGPPRLYLDSTGLHKAGCIFLAEHVARIRPRLVVFGHVHAAYGRRDVVLDSARRLCDDIGNGRGGRRTLARLAAEVLSARLRAVFLGIKRVRGAQRMTTFVNASVVGGAQNRLRNEPIVVYI